MINARSPKSISGKTQVHAAISRLRTHLITSLKAASDHLNTCQAFYGDVENRLQNATTFASNYDVQLRTQISQKEDADVAAAALELSEGTTQMQAASQAGSEDSPHHTVRLSHVV